MEFRVVAADGLASEEFDSLVVVSGDVTKMEGYAFSEDVALLVKLDADASSSTSFLIVDVTKAAGGRLIVAPTGPLNRDYDDVRRIGEAAASGIARAKKSGSVKPLLLLHQLPKEKEFERYIEVSLLGITQELYAPIQARETSEEDLEPIKLLGIAAEDEGKAKAAANLVTAIEAGRRVGRDVGQPDPERMNPTAIAQYLIEAFKESGVMVSVVDHKEMEKEYPLALSVGRASLEVPRHHPKIVRLEWKGEGDIEETLMFSGKGVVYDTGGADVKISGHMPGMSRDKCGAANIAGFVKTVSLLKPKNLHVIAELGFVRNSIGSNSYVADEVIIGHSGARVLIINTDAEGRLVMADCLSHLRQLALEKNLPNVRLMTCGTLTGHAFRSVGAYTISLDNGPALKESITPKLIEAGALFGEIIERSFVRRDDFKANKGKNSTHDVLNLGTPTPAGSRGHQFAAAFLTVASGMDKHGKDSDKPLCYTHFDIAGSACEEAEYRFHKTTGSPIISWTAGFVLPHLQ